MDGKGHDLYISTAPTYLCKIVSCLNEFKRMSVVKPDANSCVSCISSTDKDFIWCSCFFNDETILEADVLCSHTFGLNVQNVQSKACMLLFTWLYLKISLHNSVRAANACRGGITFATTSVSLLGPTQPLVKAAVRSHSAEINPLACTAIETSTMQGFYSVGDKEHGTQHVCPFDFCNIKQTYTKLFNSVPHHEDVLVEWRYSSTHSVTSALDGGELSASRFGRFTPKERAPGTHWKGGWVGPRAVVDAVVKRKIPSPVGNRTLGPRFYLYATFYKHSAEKNTILVGRSVKKPWSFTPISWLRA
jgi:hypothetical protein